MSEQGREHDALVIAIEQLRVWLQTLLIQAEATRAEHAAAIRQIVKCEDHTRAIAELEREREELRRALKDSDDRATAAETKLGQAKKAFGGIF